MRSGTFLGRRVAASVAVILVLALVGSAAELPLAQQEAIIKATAQCAVAVEYTFQYHNGQSPYGAWGGQKCPVCGGYHGSAMESFLRDERPMITVGWVISRTQVIAPDIGTNPRFIKSIGVRCGGRLLEAKIAAISIDQKAVVLETGEPLSGATPLVFDPKRSGPYFVLTRVQADSVWTSTIQPMSTNLVLTDEGRRRIAVTDNSLIVDKAGAPVGLVMYNHVRPDDSWKGSPLNWPMVTRQRLDELISQTKTRVDAAILRADLSFRTSKNVAPRSRYSRFSPDQDEVGNRLQAPALMLDQNRALVLASIKPAITARLERILIYPASGKPISARFLHSLSDYGCIVAELEKPLTGAGLTLDKSNILDREAKLLIGTEILVQGDKRVAYYGAQRILDFNPGLRGRQMPYVAGSGGYREQRAHEFLLDENGVLVAAPLVRREKLSFEERGYSIRGDPSLISAAELAEILADLPRTADAANVPLSPEQENRIAWMGIELQGLDRELARANGVSDLTSDGQSGALVTFVYPDSPAARAGIQNGWVLLRLHVSGQPKPLDVKVEDHFEGNPFPWDRLDEVTEDYFEQIPKPWPDLDNSFNRTLTDLGIGSKYQAEFFYDGKTDMRDFEVVVSPTHFDTAPKHRAAALGVTARELTFEARRYFQFKPGESGVIISKIDVGSKASTSGLKPYEIITHINDQPVQSVGEFQKLTAGQTELRLSVRRMAKGRQVKIVLPAQPTTRPG